MKKIFLFLLTFFFLATIPLTVGADATCGDGWTLTADGYCTNDNDPNIKVPVPKPVSPTPTPANQTPTSTPPNQTPTPTPTPSPGPGGGTLPECTDNYSSPEICLPKNPFQGSGGIAGSGSLTQLAAKVVVYLLYFAGIVAVIFVIIGGYKYMTAGGNEETATKGRKTMTQAIIGLVIVILAYVIITAVVNFLIKK